MILARPAAEDADVDAGLEHRRDPGPPSARPGFREQRRPHRPFAADAQRGQEPENQQVPPRLREEGQPGEGGVGQDGEAQRARPAQPVADAPEEPAAQRPAEHEPALDDRAVMAHARVGGAGGPEQLRDERRGHQRVKVHVQPVERPAQPRGDARAPLLARDLAQMRRVANCTGAGLCRLGCLYGVHALALEDGREPAADTSGKKTEGRMQNGERMEGVIQGLGLVTDPAVASTRPWPGRRVCRRPSRG